MTRKFKITVPGMLAVISGAVFAICVGCGDPSDSTSTSRTDRVPVKVSERQADEFAQAITQMFNSLNASRTVFKAREQDAVAENRRWASTVTAALDAVDWQPVFTGIDTTTPLLDKLIHAIEELPAHGLDRDCCNWERLAAAKDAFAQAISREASLVEELRLVKGFVEIFPLIDSGKKPQRSEIDNLPLGVRAMKPERLAELSEAIGRLAEVRRENAPARAALEAAGTLGWLQYAMEMRYRIVAAPFLAQKNPKSAHRAFKTELVETFRTFVSDPETAFETVIPRHPYYKKTMEGLAAYREMRKDGPFPKVSIRRKYSVGYTGDVIVDIKKRLAREGYFSGTIDDKFDAELKESVKAYQSTHGYNVTGVLEPAHGKSLNVTLDKRIRQIELSLQRWRESEIRDGGELYVRANIPEFKMEVWKGDERVFKNRVVVGNNNWDKDPVSNVEGRINRTKIFSAQIENIVLNPRWNVPLRIRQVEIEMDLLSQPDYLLKNNYVIEMLPDGREIVYQKSGEGNALGRIKFNFPNKYGIFMHDTNLKAFFDKEIRAYSHGCVRLDDPVPVAKYFITQGSDMTAAQVDAILNQEEPDLKSVKLETPIPIYIEYNSVGVDDEGRMMFFSDVYWYDRDYFNGKIPYSAEELELLRRKITKPD